MNMTFTSTVNNDCPVGENPRRTIKDNLVELTECIHMLENQVDMLLQILWSKEDNNPEKSIEIVDMDSNIVHDLDVVRRINAKLGRITSGIGC
mgnify:CR=1 FL=1